MTNQSWRPTDCAKFLASLEGIRTALSSDIITLQSSESVDVDNVDDVVVGGWRLAQILRYATLSGSTRPTQCLSLTVGLLSPDPLM